MAYDFRLTYPATLSVSSQNMTQSHLFLSVVPHLLQVQVHIIEARELKAENMDGTSDPVVYVECFGQKQNTICVKGVSTYSSLVVVSLKGLFFCVDEKGRSLV